MKYLLTIALLFGLSGSAIATTTDKIPPEDPEKGYREPFQLFDNVYYVGDKWVSSYVIATSAGLILVDTLESPYGRWIPDNMRKLGLDPADIKYIVITHGHSDHFGCAEYLQSQYGSEVVMAAADLALAKQQVEKSREDPYGAFSLPKFELIERDGSTLTLGDTTLKLYLTPGHTPGSMSVDFLAKAGSREYRAFVVGGMGTNFEGLDHAEQYLASVRRVRQLASERPVVQVNLSNHPHMNQLFERRERASVEGNVQPYVDRKGFFDFLNTLEQRGLKKLEEETEGKLASD
ncbi:MBL fold metallo-hydrolase [Microbulbifer hainanensis]|uniref:MBL fold metallo-hydrolase n=1 Tax=Microbulbifer hainanensis TaxID=2735675 RepID=UPI0018672532|nr:MBL fold metallo-hydrolase [Microbulbifer hainanensis]